MSATSLVLPLVNAAATWPQLSKALHAALGPRDELVVVDNASRDNTAALVRADGVKVVSIKSRVSLGVALQAGVDAATHDRVLLWHLPQSLDSAADITLMLQEAAHTKADVLQGIRGNRNLDTDKSLLALITTGMARHATDRIFTDPASGLALCHRPLLVSLGIQNEELRHLAFIAASRGASVEAVNLTRAKKPAKTKKLDLDRHMTLTFEFAAFVMAVAWTLFKRNPLHGFGVPAIFLGTLGFGVFVLALLSLLAGVFVSGLWLAVVGLTFIAIQLMALGFVGEVFKRMKASYAPAYLLGEAQNPSPAVPVVNKPK